MEGILCLKAISPVVLNQNHDRATILKITLTTKRKTKRKSNFMVDSHLFICHIGGTILQRKVKLKTGWQCLSCLWEILVYL